MPTKTTRQKQSRNYDIWVDGSGFYNTISAPFISVDKQKYSSLTIDGIAVTRLQRECSKCEIGQLLFVSIDNVKYGVKCVFCDFREVVYKINRNSKVCEACPNRFECFTDGDHLCQKYESKNGNIYDLGKENYASH